MKNKLEQSLESYAKSASFEAEFYKNLLDENIVVLIRDNKNYNGRKFFFNGEQINIRSYEDKVIPIFTSISRIFENNVISGEVKYLELNGADFFNLTKGASYILNPYSKDCKELILKEVKEILDRRYLDFK